MAKAEGVFPCYKNQFHIGDAAESKNDIAECESFSVSIDNGVETWNSFTQEGWQSALQTGKAITISVSAKRSIGDPGNDFVAGKWLANGQDATHILTGHSRMEQWCHGIKR